MAERVECKAVVGEVLALQREMYAGGDVAAVWELLAEDVVWHVPGTSPIAGDYAGRDSVMGYFRLRRAWLIPLDQQHFDRVWAATRRVPFVYIQRVRSQECAASTMLGHRRFLEFFEAAFIEYWRDRFGQLDARLGPGRRLTGAAVNVRYLAPVRCDDELRIDVVLIGK